MFRRLDISLAKPGEGLRPIVDVGPVFSRSNMSSVNRRAIVKRGVEVLSKPLPWAIVRRYEVEKI